VEAEVTADEQRGSSAASIAEIALAIVLCLLAAAAIALAVKYYR